MARFALGAAVTNLDAVTATGAGAAVEAGTHRYSVWQIVAASVTTGGTVVIQGSLDGTSYFTISSTAVSADGTTGVVVSAAYPYLRANLTARTDGTYTVKYVLAKED